MQSGSYDGDGPLVAVSASTGILRHPEAGEHLLSPLEQKRATRFHHESVRNDFIAAHILVRFCAARLLGLPASTLTLAQRCPDCGDAAHGKPYLPDHPDVHVSLSHTQGLVAAAAGLHPVGVDVELPTRGDASAEMYERVLAEAELRQVRAHRDPARAFLRQWVRKEAMIKIGRTTLDTLADVDLSVLPVDLVDGAVLHSRFGDLHILDWQDRQDGQDGPGSPAGAGATLAAVSTSPPRLDTAGVLARQR
ncbi:4'-phosphopantetheinyl transferase family protein [Kitasatospora sp. NPDC057223]|uniref:4'-phosphopantetheinyl transferase family protein n=1 Tax=Kitasatospora sp. NPDC057223 TaxID=3346055 RepID=UPI003628C3E5